MRKAGSLLHHKESQRRLLDIYRFAGVKTALLLSGVAFGNLIGNPVRIRPFVICGMSVGASRLVIRREVKNES
jgi:hypothetical protein